MLKRILLISLCVGDGILFSQYHDIPDVVTKVETNSLNYYSNQYSTNMTTYGHAGTTKGNLNNITNINPALLKSANGFTAGFSLFSEELDHLLHLDGSRGVSFDTAVWAMGPSTDRGANDRERSSVISGGSSLLFDFGAIIGGYCSDFGRTLAVGKSGSELEEVYDIVIESAAAGLSAVKPGVLARDVDRATRKVIEDAGYGDKFRHRTGHCIGLDVHEYPFISEEDETVLEAGMTFTIEPSIFWPGRVGARIEDIIVVTQEGGRKLNDYSDDFVIIDSASASLDTGGDGCVHDHQEHGGCLPGEVVSE